MNRIKIKNYLYKIRYIYFDVNKNCVDIGLLVIMKMVKE